MNAGRDTTAVVRDRAGAVGVERHRNLGGVPGQRLVDCVVDDLVDHVVQARPIVGVADVHAGPLAYGIKAFQNLDRLRTIRIGREIAGGLGHVGSLWARERFGRA
jgi:hypothetical protein